MNIFDKIYASAKPFLEMTGYTFKTTFWQDFGIAETISGKKGGQDTFGIDQEKDKGKYILVLQPSL